MTTHQTTAAPGATEAADGRWLHNPATGELAHLLHAAPDGRRLEFDLWLQPGAAVARAHVHDRLVERFEVLTGAVGFRIGDREQQVRPGDGVTEVPAGTVHDWWNAGEGIGRVRVEIAATPDAPGRPAERFLAMIEAVWSLGAQGRVNAQGAPDPLWLMAVAREYGDAIRLASPPAPVQALVVGPLAALARLTGRDPRDAALHGPTGACAIAAPDEDGLAALLGQPVGARAARGRA